MFSDLWQDLRYSFRMMLNNPGFTLAAILILTLGIGANTFVFSLVNGVLLSPLPYPQPDRLFRLMQSYPEKGLDSWNLSQANFARYHQENRSFEALAAYSVTGVNLTGLDRPERLQISRVTADFFKVLAVNPIRGRTFSPEEDAQGKNNVCVLSYNFWQRRFGGDDRVLGKSIILNNTSTEVVGVMPAGFKFPASVVEMWLPLGLNPQTLYPWFLTGIGKLKPDMQPSAAQVDTNAILWNFGQQNPQMVSRTSPPTPGLGLKTVVTPLKEAIVGKTRKQLLILQIAVALVLLIACANVANLLLSRATSRTHEIALRLAIGATPGRVIRQLLTESVSLALVSAFVGAAFAWWCLRAISHLPSIESIPRIEEAGISLTVLAFAIAMTLLTGLLFGLMPAIRTYRLGLKSGLNEGQRGGGGGTGNRMNSMLVATQIALSLLLLIGTGLMLKSLQRLLAVNPGFQSQNVLTMIMSLASNKYADLPQAFNFYRSLRERAQTIPGVQTVALASNIPFGSLGVSDGYLVEGQTQAVGSDAAVTQAQLKIVSPGYFKAMGMSLLYGRDFSETDTRDVPLAVVVDKTLAQRYWPGNEAIGKRIRLSGDPPWLSIIGVVSGIKDENLAGEMRPHIYFSYGQFPQRRMFLVVNTGSDLVVSASSIQDKIRELDTEVPVYAVSTMTTVLNKTLNNQWLTNFLLTAFAVVALLMATIGIYGMMSVYVASRTAEFAVRMAVGAQPGHLLRSVMRQGLLLVLIGVVVGTIGAWILTRTISNLLFEVSATDPIIFITLPLFLAIVALSVCYIPARRAAHTDPMAVLRHE